MSSKRFRLLSSSGLPVVTAVPNLRYVRLTWSSNPQYVDGRNDYAQFAEACFTAFGDRVKHWITFNEPQTFTVLGYGNGIHAPGRCSDRSKCTAGNTATEPYLAAHNVLLAHAAAVDVYKRKFKAMQGGAVGISLDCEWGEPETNSAADVEAAERHVLFQLGW